jgi:uncharacterized protein (TIGR02246 family)
MKHIFIFFTITILTFMGCQEAVNTEAEKSEIKTVLDKYIFSIENEDIEAYGSIFVHDPDMINFGTGANERIVGWDALKKAIQAQNAAISGTEIIQSDITVNLSNDGKFAWATSLWDFKSTMGEQVMQLPVRCSWILEKFDDEWKIVHFHKSVGAAW